MSDLIERLRSGDASWILREKAADEIEQQQAEIERLKGHIQEHQSRDALQQMEIERLTESLEIEQNAYDLLAKDHAKLQAVVDAAKVVVRDLDLMNLPASCPDLRKALAALETDADRRCPFLEFENSAENCSLPRGHSGSCSWDDGLIKWEGCVGPDDSRRDSAESGHDSDGEQQ